MTKSIFSAMVQSIVVEKAWRQAELDLAGYNDIHSVRKQKEMNTDTQFIFILVHIPGS